MGQTSPATMRQVVLRYFTCLDTENWPQMVELWASAGRLRAVGARPRDGRDEVIQYFAKLFDPWPAHRDHPERLIIAPEEETVVAEVTFIGTTPDGREVRFEAIDVFDFADGLIAKMTNWYDIDYARRSLTAPAAALES